VQRPPNDELSGLFSQRREPVPPMPTGPDEKVLGAKILLFVAVGFIILGATLSGFTTVLEEPDSDDYDDSDKYEKARESYQRSMKWLFFLGEELMYIGVLVMITGFSFAALASPKMNPSVRMGLLIASGLVLGFMISNKPGLLSLLSMF
jgi:hypothetical protein